MKTLKPGHNLREDLFNALVAVDVQDEPASAIEPQEGLGFGKEHLEPMGHDILCVVDPTFLLVPDA